MHAAIHHNLLDKNNSFIFKNIEKKTPNLKKYLSLDPIEGNTYHYPGCDNKCLDNENNTKFGAKYIFNDGRCFKAVVPCNKYDCLDKINLNAWPDIYDDPRMFTSCDKEFDTRQLGSRARFIRISRGNSLKPVAISLIEAYDIFGNYIQPIAGRAEPEKKPYYGEYLLSPDIDKYAMTENTENAFIQIDLGYEYNIFMIIIVNAPFILNNIYRNQIVLIDSNGTVTFKTDINYVSDLYVVETKKSKESLTVKRPTVIKQPTHKYPECIPNGCLDKKKYTISDYEYLLSGNRCLKNVIPCIQCLDNNIPLHYFKSCNPNVDTRIASLSISNVIFDIFSDDTNMIGIEIFYYDNIIYPKSLTVGPVNKGDCRYKLLNKLGCMLFKNDFVQAMLPDDVLITDIHISTKTKSLMYGNRLYVMDNKNIIQHHETITHNTPFVEKDDIITFKLKLHGTGNEVGNMRQPFVVVDYPECILDGCLTSDGEQIPGYIYNFSNGKCAKAVSKCVGCLDAVMNITKIDNNTASCSDYYETRLPSFFGRYVKIVKPNGLGFNLAEINIKNFKLEHSILSSNSYPINRGYYAHNAYDGRLNTYASVVSASEPPYMLFDLGSNLEITDVNLFSIDSSLIGTYVYIISEDGNTRFLKSIDLPLIDNKLNIKPYMLSSQELENLPKTTITNTYNYPACVPNGCLQKDLPIADQKYYVPKNNTCYIPIKVDSSCFIDKEFNRVYGDKMDECYKSCSLTEDTRYSPFVMGRYVRINNTSNIHIAIQSFFINENEYTMRHVFIKNPENSKGDDLNKSIITVGAMGYVQIDLGKNELIGKVTYSGTNMANNSSLTIYNSIDDNKPDVDLVFLTNLTSNSDVIAIKQILDGSVKSSVVENFNYPYCATTYSDCLNSINYPRPFFTYTFDDGRCVASKNIVCNLTNCINSVQDKTITSLDMNRFFNSCIDNIDTRYPPITARYVRIQSTDTIGFKIRELYVLYNNNRYKEPVKVYGLSVQNINHITDHNNATYGTISDSLNPFIELDYGIVNVSSVEIKHFDNSLVGKILYLLNDQYNIIYQKTISLTESYIITSENSDPITPIQLKNRYQYPSCTIMEGCLVDGKQIENQQYVIGDLCYEAVSDFDANVCLNNANNLYGINMDNCFRSCSLTQDTRYDNVSGKYIRLINQSIGTELTISSLQGIDFNNQEIRIYDTFAKGGFSPIFRSDNLLIPNTATKIVGFGSYIQIAFNTNTFIKKVKVSIPVGMGLNALINSKINVLDSDGFIISEYIISDKDVLINNAIIFDITKNQDGNVKLPIIETVNYPQCVTDSNYECVSSSGTSRINMKYMLEDGRCAISINKCDCMESLVSNTLTAQEMTNFISCDSNKDTRFPSITGRYIRLHGNNGFTVNSIRIKNKNDEIIVPTKSMAYPLSNNTYSRNMIAGNATIIGDSNDISIKPFAFIDFEQNVQINSIEINGENLVGVLLYVIDNADVTVYQQPLNSNNNTIHPIYNNINYDPINTVNSFNYDSCVSLGCVTDDGVNIYHIPNQIYKTVDNRCLKAIGYQNKSLCLDRIHDNTIDINSCFHSCSSLYDSRYKNAIGRFVRIVRTDDKTNIKLVRIVIYKNETDFITPVMAHANPVKNFNYGEYMIDDSLTTFAEAEGLNAYLQIDLGSDQTVYMIKLIASDMSLVNTKLLVIKENQKLTASFHITEDTDLNNIKLTNNEPETEVISIDETFSWNCRESDCVNSNGKTKRLFKYNLPDNRCVISKNICSSDNCINNLIDYKLHVKSILDDFDSCVIEYDSQFTTIIGRYVRIRRINSNNRPIQIYTIKVFNKNKMLLTTPTTKTFVKPFNNSYGSLMLDNNDSTYTITGNPNGRDCYVQLDLGVDSDIARIEIITDDMLQDTELLIINNLNYIVYKNNFLNLQYNFI